MPAAKEKTKSKPSKNTTSEYTPSDKILEIKRRYKEEMKEARKEANAEELKEVTAYIASEGEAHLNTLKGAVESKAGKVLRNCTLRLDKEGNVQVKFRLGRAIADSD